LRHGQRQTAVTKTERTQFHKACFCAICTRSEHLFAEHIATDDTEITNAISDHSRHVVIPHQQQIHWQAFAKAEQLVATTPELEPATREQILRCITEATRFLDRDTQTITCTHA